MAVSATNPIVYKQKLLKDRLSDAGLWPLIKGLQPNDVVSGPKHTISGLNIQVFRLSTIISGSITIIFGSNIPVFGSNIPVFSSNIPVFDSILPVFSLSIPVFGSIMIIFGSNIPVFGLKTTVFDPETIILSLKIKTAYRIKIIFSQLTSVVGCNSFEWHRYSKTKDNKQHPLCPQPGNVPPPDHRHGGERNLLYKYLHRLWLKFVKPKLWRVSFHLLFNRLILLIMRRKKIIISFSHFSNDALIAVTWFILSKMTGNPDLTTPDPTLAEVKTLVEDLETKNIAAKEGGHTAHAQMVQARLKLLEALRYLGLYVEKTAKGNVPIMVSSGFPVTDDPVPADRKDFRVKYGANSGEILVGCKAFHRAKSYVWQRFVGEAPPTDENQWIWCGVSTRTRIGLTNLDCGKVVWLRYCAVTAAGMQSWSDPISIMVV